MDRFEQELQRILESNASPLQIRALKFKGIVDLILNIADEQKFVEEIEEVNKKLSAKINEGNEEIKKLQTYIETNKWFAEKCETIKKEYDELLKTKLEIDTLKDKSTILDKQENNIDDLKKLLEGNQIAYIEQIRQQIDNIRYISTSLNNSSGTLESNLKGVIEGARQNLDKIDKKSSACLKILSVVPLKTRYEDLNKQIADSIISYDRYVDDINKNIEELELLAKHKESISKNKDLYNGFEKHMEENRCIYEEIRQFGEDFLGNTIEKIEEALHNFDKKLKGHQALIDNSKLYELEKKRVSHYNERST